MKDKINVHETNNKNKNIRDLYRGINEFKKGYQPRINIIKDENGNLLADPHPRERVPGTQWRGGWVGPRAVLDAVVMRKIPSSRLESNPRNP